MNMIQMSSRVISLAEPPSQSSHEEPVTGSVSLTDLLQSCDRISISLWAQNKRSHAPIYSHCLGSFFQMGAIFQLCSPARQLARGGSYDLQFHCSLVIGLNSSPARWLLHVILPYIHNYNKPPSWSDFRRLEFDSSLK